MDKHELVGMTIQKLIEHFKMSPESFEYYDSERRPNQAVQPTITWQPKIQLNDHSSTVVNDPNNVHAVIVMFNPMINELSCYLFLKAPPNLITNHGTTADCVITSKRAFEKWRGNYRKFKKLRDLIIARDKRRENMDYLRKLSSVFPDAMDGHWIDR
jgi:hypothetical protein